MFNFIYTTEYITKKCLKDKEDLIFLEINANSRRGGNRQTGDANG